LPGYRPVSCRNDLRLCPLRGDDACSCDFLELRWHLYPGQSFPCRHSRVGRLTPIRDLLAIESCPRLPGCISRPHEHFLCICLETGRNDAGLDALRFFQNLFGLRDELRRNHRVGLGGFLDQNLLCVGLEYRRNKPHLGSLGFSNHLFRYDLGRFRYQYARETETGIRRGWIGLTILCKDAPGKRDGCDRSENQLVHSSFPWPHLATRRQSCTFHLSKPAPGHRPDRLALA